MRARRWIFWLFFIVGALICLSALSVYLVLRGLDMAPRHVTTGSTLTLDMAGELPEDRLFDLTSPFFDVESVTFKDVIDSIERAKNDARIASLLVRVRGAAIGWAKAEELRNALIDFGTSGKKVVSYLEYGSNLDYFLASAADTIYVHPLSILDLRGLQAEVTFMRSTLDKLGIEAEFEQIGAYKNAPDVYTRESLSPAHREALTAIVDDIYGRLVDAIAGSRNLSVEEVKKILDRGPFRAQDAQQLGLVDELLYRDDVHSRLSGEGADYRPVTVAGYQRADDDGLGLDGRPRIALIYGVGMIVGGRSDEDALFGRVMGSDTLADTFKEVREDDSVRAVVFRIQSPGGSDVASDIIWREASLTMEKKPVVVSMSDVAASGGYWIATASHAIVAEPSTVTGSIGIYGGKFNLQGLYQKIGFKKERVMKGKSADFWSDTRSFTPEERVRFRRLLEAGYQQFVDRVAQAREMEPEEVDAIGQGRVWTGAQAMELGLVDELGGLDRALALAKERAAIPDDAAVRIEIYPKKRGFFQMLVTKMAYGAPGVAALELLAPEELLERSPVLRLLTEGRRLAVMPFRVRIH
jgi:protease-4